MVVEVEGVSYYTAAEVARHVDVSRTTLWRWRSKNKIPQGRRYRDKQVLFTEAELEHIREYAHRMEPVAAEAPGQLKLFNNRGGS